jgi:predicted DCC family thiol-disulfide oxidoreductase YuxK
VSLLKKSPGQEHIIFSDIAAKDYNAADHENLSYATAMKQIYAIKDNGLVEYGTDAFFSIYAKAGWDGLAMLLKAPLFGAISRVGYKFFAKYRLKITGRRSNE